MMATVFLLVLDHLEKEIAESIVKHDLVFLLYRVNSRISFLPLIMCQKKHSSGFGYGAIHNKKTLINALRLHAAFSAILIDVYAHFFNGPKSTWMSNIFSLIPVFTCVLRPLDFETQQQ
jgi:hypothetical protein